MLFDPGKRPDIPIIAISNPVRWEWLVVLIVVLFELWFNMMILIF
jgi:hypothetical protein